MIVYKSDISRCTFCLRSKGKYDELEPYGWTNRQADSPCVTALDNDIGCTVNMNQVENVWIHHYQKEGNYELRKYFARENNELGSWQLYLQLFNSNYLLCKTIIQMKALPRHS